VVPCCDIHDELVDVVVRDVRDGDAVQLEEDGGGQPAEPLVPVDERAALHEGLQQGRALAPDIRVGVVAEERRLRTGRGGAQQAGVTHRHRLAEESGREREQIVDVEVLERFRHRPSRSSASA
jgi:hypothetical protein